MNFYITNICVFGVKAYMKSYIPLETVAIFSSEPFLKQGISSEHVMVDFICMG